MGNTPSEHFKREEVDYWWPQKVAKPFETPPEVTTPPKTVSTDSLNEIKQEMMRKHDKRREIIAQKQREFRELRETVRKQREQIEALSETLLLDGSREQKDALRSFEGCQRTNEELREKVVELTGELLKGEGLKQRNEELATRVDGLRAELRRMAKAMEGFEQERADYQVHVTALKDVVKVSKQMLGIRENQLKELTQKISEIEQTMAEYKATSNSGEVREEYERQLRNIRNLRQLYEDRQKAHKKEKDELVAQLDDAKYQLEVTAKKNKELEERIAELERDNSSKYDEIHSLQSNLGLTKAECREYQAEMSTINQLFSQILLGFNNCQAVDLDNLIRLLEENHDLLQEIVNESDESKTASSALPKVLLDLVNQVNRGTEEEGEGTSGGNPEPTHNLASTSEIVENLPKVWKVLIELLSHHCVPENSFSEENPCYKVVQTTNGQRLVLSVSQTYIRLKNLILEKKSLEKEMGRLKQLNTHLETRLQDQEKRLEMVSTELNKTWHIVGKLQKQHQQLHTHEKILRYELAQKRKLLTQLKEELEYCREKWQQAREKNSTTEKEWNELRTERSSRKKPPAADSVESGYSDEDSDQKESVAETIKEELTAVDRELEEAAEGTTPKRTVSEELFQARDERFRKLEEETKALMSKVAETSTKRENLCEKLESLHETYGGKSDEKGDEDGGE